MNKFTEQAGIVQKELNKKSRHLPMRRLLDAAEDVVMAICPCWMASPLSVSQLLGSKQYFDVVIFDEASQILPEDAVPSLMRARRAVVAGDEHQLPPTTFFMGVDDDDDDAGNAQDADTLVGEGASTGIESILRQMQAFLTPWWLIWHYRSRDERLIAFSNRYIYHDSLITFPGIGQEDAIKHVAVAQLPRDGEENSVGAEVDRVVDLVLEHAEKRPNESLGVIAMGITHQRRIDAALESARMLRPELDEFFDERKREKFFVKNLERVQGDERDAIILSIGYGKDRGGKLPYRFGPLLMDGGHRRLNVAVTRSKNRLTTVSSFTDADMDPLRSSARGVELLRLYLRYSRSCGTDLDVGKGLSSVALNPFEADIADALEREGIPLIPQWGASSYRIDLVAKHPHKPGRFVLAIECDGRAYHTAPTARDRDRLRQQHLEALGWRFHRIWSTDWFLRRQFEIDKAKRKYAEAVEIADREDNQPAGVTGDVSIRPTLQVVGSGVDASVDTPPRGQFPIPRYLSSIDAYSVEQLLLALKWIETDGIRRTHDELIRETTRQLGFERIGPRIRERLEQACLLLESRRM
jgi:very-short-patch-repair endonuclease